jgi:hypothetical protein
MFPLDVGEGTAKRPTIGVPSGLSGCIEHARHGEVPAYFVARTAKPRHNDLG